MTTKTTVWYRDATDDPDDPFTVVWRGDNMRWPVEGGYLILNGGEYRLYGSADPDWEPISGDEMLWVPSQYVLLVRQVACYD